MSSNSSSSSLRDVYRLAVVFDPKPPVKFKVVSHSTWKNSIVFSCTDGALRLYESDAECAVWRLSVLAENFLINKKPLEKFEIIEFHDQQQDSNNNNNNGSSSGSGLSFELEEPKQPISSLLIGIVDGLIRIYSFPSLTPLESNSSFSSIICHTFSLNRKQFPLFDKSQSLRLAVATKKRSIQIYQFIHNPARDSLESGLVNGNFRLESEYQPNNLIEPPKLIEFCTHLPQSNLILSSRREYYYYSPQSGQMNELFSIGKKSSIPIILKLKSGNSSINSISASSISSSNNTAVASSSSSSSSSASIPIINKTSPDELLLFQDSTGIFLDLDGRPSRREGFQYTELILSAIQISSAFILLVTISNIEIRSLYNNSLIQLFPLSKNDISNLSLLISNSNTNNSSNNNNNSKDSIQNSIQNHYIQSAHSNLFFIHSLGIKCLFPIPIQQQLDQYIQLKQWKESILLFSLYTDYTHYQWRKSINSPPIYISRTILLTDLYIISALEYFKSNEFDYCFQSFSQSNIDPRLVLSLFPDVLNTTTNNNNNNNSIEQQLYILLSLIKLNSSFKPFIQIPQPIRLGIAESTLLKALGALIPYLISIQTRIRSQPNTTFYIPNNNNNTTAAAVAASISSSASNNSIAAAAKEISMDSLPSLPVFIDTALLKCYLLTDQPLDLLLSQRNNSCDINESTIILKSYEKYNELTILYRNRLMHRESLELLNSLLLSSNNNNNNNGNNNNNNNNGNNDNSQSNIFRIMMQYLQYMCQNLPIGMNNSNNSIQLDSNSNSIPSLADQLKWIFHYSKPLFQLDRDSALSIFTSCHNDSSIDHIRSHSTRCISPSLVLEFLKKSTDREICCQYLESLILGCGIVEKSSNLHNELILNYLNEVLIIRKEAAQRLRTRKSMISGDSPANPRIKGKSEKKDNNNDNNNNSGDDGELFPPEEELNSVLSSNESQRLNRYRSSLLDFLVHSLHYTPEKMLSRFPRSDLLPERAILLRRIHQHAAAIEIYARQLGDFIAVEEYCREIYDQASTEEEKQIFLTALRVYLKNDQQNSIESNGSISSSASAANSTNSEPLLGPSLRLLTLNHDRIDPASAIALLPGSIPISSLSSYFSCVLSSQFHRQRHLQIIKNLVRSEHLSSRLKFLELARNSTHMNSDTQCASCNKKIGNSAFARYPNGAVMHYVCFTVQNQSGSASAVNNHSALNGSSTSL